MPAFCRAMSGGSASRNPTPAYDGATPRHTGIRNRFPPAANAPSGKTGNSETKSGKDCGLTTDSGSVSRKKTNRQPFSNTGLHRTVRANHSGFGKWKAKQRLFDTCRNGRKLRPAAPKNTVIIRLWINPFLRGGFEAFAFPHVPKVTHSAPWPPRCWPKVLPGCITSNFATIPVRPSAASRRSVPGYGAPESARSKSTAASPPQATDSTSASRGFPPGSSPRSHPSATRRSEWWAKDRCYTARSGR